MRPSKLCRYLICWHRRVRNWGCLRNTNLETHPLTSSIVLWLFFDSFSKSFLQVVGWFRFYFKIGCCRSSFQDAFDLLAKFSRKLIFNLCKGKVFRGNKLFNDGLRWVFKLQTCVLLRGYRLVPKWKMLSNLCRVNSARSVFFQLTINLIHNLSVWNGTIILLNLVINSWHLFVHFIAIFSLNCWNFEHVRFISSIYSCVLTDIIPSLFLTHRFQTLLLFLL